MVETGLPWSPYLGSWAIGLGTVLLTAVATGWVTRRGRMRDVTWPTASPRVLLPVLVVVLTGASLWVMFGIFAGNPHLVDEMAQLLQARAFVAGRLAAPEPERKIDMLA